MSAKYDGNPSVYGNIIEFSSTKKSSKFNLKFIGCYDPEQKSTLVHKPFLPSKESISRSGWKTPKI